MALTEWYVGTGGNDTTGDGTSHATRWLTIQKALDSMTTGQENRLNCYGSETLTATLDFTTYGIPTTDSVTLTIQGYTASAGDGGVFALNGGGNEIITNDNLDFIHFRHMKFTNWGAGTAFSLDNNCWFVECEFDGEGSRAQIIDSDSGTSMISCHVHSMAVSGSMIQQWGGGGWFYGNYFQADSCATNANIVGLGSAAYFVGNIVVANSSNSFNAVSWNSGSGSWCLNNTIVNLAGSYGTAIETNSGITQTFSIQNNIIHGFSTGIDFSVAGAALWLYGNNKFWNTTTNESLGTNTVIFGLGGNAALTADPLTAPASGDFSLNNAQGGGALCRGAIDFNVPEFTTTSSYRDIGAVQHNVAGGSTGFYYLTHFIDDTDGGLGTGNAPSTIVPEINEVGASAWSHLGTSTGWNLSTACNLFADDGVGEGTYGGLSNVNMAGFNLTKSDFKATGHVYLSGSVYRSGFIFRKKDSNNTFYMLYFDAASDEIDILWYPGTGTSWTNEATWTSTGTSTIGQHRFDIELNGTSCKVWFDGTLLGTDTLVNGNDTETEVGLYTSSHGSHAMLAFYPINTEFSTLYPPLTVGRQAAIPHPLYGS